MRDTIIGDITLMQGDCLERMKEIPDRSVSACITDLPYGVLNAKNENAQWDRELNLDALWVELLRVCRDNAAIVFFGQGLFSAKLITSKPDLYRYTLIWDKVNRPTGFLDANRKPMKIHEDILVFYGSQPTYNPQMSVGERVHSRGKCGNGIGGGYKRLLRQFQADGGGAYRQEISDLDTCVRQGARQILPSDAEARVVA